MALTYFVGKMVITVIKRMLLPVDIVCDVVSLYNLHCIRNKTEIWNMVSSWILDIIEQLN